MEIKLVLPDIVGYILSVSVIVLAFTELGKLYLTIKARQELHQIEKIMRGVRARGAAKGANNGSQD